jgi:hypothetical protein
MAPAERQLYPIGLKLKNSNKIRPFMAGTKHKKQTYVNVKENA